MKLPESTSPGDVATAALAYAGRGWSVIPIEPRGKRPLVAWLEFQQRRAEADEIHGWFRRCTSAIVTRAGHRRGRPRNAVRRR